MLQDPAAFPERVERHRPKLVAIYEDDFNFLSKMCLTRMREVAWQMAETPILLARRSSHTVPMPAITPRNICNMASTTYYWEKRNLRWSNFAGSYWHQESNEWHCRAGKLRC